MKAVIRTALFLFFITNAQAQKTFIKHFGTSESEYGTSLVNNSAGTLIGQVVTDNGNIYFGLVMTDEYGRKIWSRVYSNRHSNIIRCVEKLGTGYIVLGNSWDNGSPNYKMELMNIDSNGNIIWAKEFTLSNAELTTGLAVHNNEIYVTCIADYNVGSVYPKIAWMKLDASGSVLQSKMWSASFMIQPFAMAVNAAGKTGIACESNSFGTGTPTFTNLVVLQVDATGNIEWSKSFGTTYDEKVGGMTADGNDWVVTGQTYFMNNEWDMSLFRIGNTGNLAWANFYDAGTIDGEAGRSVITGGNGYVIAGDAGTFNERNMHLASISGSGSVNWCMEYNVSVLFTNYPYDVVSLPGGDGYLFTGDLRPPTSFRDAALIRTDDVGQAGCFSLPLALTSRTETVEDITVALTNETLVLSETSPTWQEITINVNENKICAFPIAEFDYISDTASCPDLCFTFIDESVNATTWDWSFSNGTPSSSNLQDPGLVCFVDEGTFQVRLIAGDGTTTDTITYDVFVSDELCDTTDSTIVIPNVISPNGDFKNDQFIVKNLPDNFKLIIYNRWGNEMFVTTDKNKMWPEKPAEDDVTEGVYYYVLKILEPDQKEEFKGNFMVIRNDN